MTKAAAATTPNNLALWEGFCNTDPDYTKSFNRGGGFSGTAINAVYITRRLTEQFGPVGIGWRFVIEEERYVEGHVLPDGVSRAMIHVIRGHLDYAIRDAWYSTGPQFGQTTFVGENKNGIFTDEEAPKKSVTDCLGKCALQLGVGADIHMGHWDDNKYTADGGGAAAAARKPRTPKNATAAPGTPPVVSPTGVDLSNIAVAINTTSQPPELLVVLEDLRRSPQIYNDPHTWEQVCKLIADKFKATNILDTNEAKMIVGVLQSEHLRLGQMKGAGYAVTQQQAVSNVPPVGAGAPGVPA